MTSANGKINRYAQQIAEENRQMAILNGNGLPTKITLQTHYAPGPLAMPVILNPMPPNEYGISIVPAFGGATRIETAASVILAGAMTADELLRCDSDDERRCSLIKAATKLAIETINQAAAFNTQPADPTGAESQPD